MIFYQSVRSLKPPQPPSAVLRKLEQKFPLMTPISDMPDLPWDVMAFSSCHAVLLSLNARFRHQNGPSKPHFGPIFEAFHL